VQDTHRHPERESYQQFSQQKTPSIALQHCRRPRRSEFNVGPPVADERTDIRIGGREQGDEDVEEYNSCYGVPAV
jgi:hypothetical protein